MGSSAITQEAWLKLVEAYRRLPGTESGAHRIAAAEVGLDSRTARKAWEQGLTKGWHGARKPIRDLLLEEQELARARLQDMQDEAKRAELERDAIERAEVRRKAMLDVTEARTQEGQVVRLIRANTLAALGSIAKLNQALQKAVSAMQYTVTAMCADDPVTGAPRLLGLGEMRTIKDLVATTTSALRQAGDAAQRAMEAERLLLGEPSRIVGIQVQPLSLTDARDRVAMAARAIARMEGRLIDATLVNEGLTNPSEYASLGLASKQGQGASEQPHAAISPPALAPLTNSRDHATLALVNKGKGDNAMLSTGDTGPAVAMSSATTSGPQAPPLTPLDTLPLDPAAPRPAVSAAPATVVRVRSA